jgi:Histidine kinase-, DNA gyrase B-, and HSP90-like ATPase
MRGGYSLAARIVKVLPRCLSSAWLVTTQALFLSFALPPGQSMERLFEAFYTTKPEGMGMGLSSSRSIIEAHGGRLWPAANGDYGASVHFTLPTEEGDPHG